MINKKISILLISIASTILVSCSTKVLNEDKVIDTVVIDENAKETAKANDSFNVVKVKNTENLINEDQYSEILMDNGKLIRIKYNLGDNQNEGTINQPQFPKSYIEGLEIGTITDEIDNNRNKISWDKKDIQGQLITGYMDRHNIRILKDNKVYMLDDNYELKEIKAYEKLIKDKNGDLNRFDSSYDGKLDIHYFDDGNGIEKIVVIDPINDKYYEIKGDIINDFINKKLNILSIENEKIYVSILDSMSEADSIVGYIENNKLYTFFEIESAIEVKAGMDVIYSNNNILFSGYVEGDYGLWRYDIDKKELYKEANLKYTNNSSTLNRDKNLMVISSYDSYGKQHISLARVKQNLEISNIQDITDIIAPTKDIKLNRKFLRGWVDSNKFYVECGDYEMIDNEETLVDNYYEVYELKN